MTSDREKYKQLAAMEAVTHVKSGMIVGLGHGSTVRYALEEIARKLETGELANIVGIPCSLATEQIAGNLGINLRSLNALDEIDITIDGADEVDMDLNLIKGGGGALLREKIVAQASKQVIIAVDESKLSKKLGSQFALPVEIVHFGSASQIEFLEGLGATVTRRLSANGEPVLSDQGNLLIDCNFGSIEDTKNLALRLEQRAGIVEHGLFLGLASQVIVGGSEGLRTLTPKS